jgi:hypothetical protein
MGQANFAHLGAGHYRATAHKKGLGHGSAHVSLRGGEHKSVTIHLHQRGKRKGNGTGGAQAGGAQAGGARTGGAQLGILGKRVHSPVAPHYGE